MRRATQARRPTCRRCGTAVEAGRVAALYVFDPGPEGSIGDTSWIVDARKRGTLPLLIVQGVLLTELARAADFVLPGASYVEKEASYTNDQGRLQGTARAIPPPGDAMEDWQILVNLGAALGVPFDYTSAADVRADIAARIADASGVAGLTTLAFNRPVSKRALAAGVESVGAMEVGLHVPGSAAGQRHRRPSVAAAAAGRDSAEGSASDQRWTDERGDTQDAAASVVCLGVLVSSVSSVSARRRARAERPAEGRRRRRRRARQRCAPADRRASRSRSRCPKGFTPSRTSRAIRR